MPTTVGSERCLPYLPGGELDGSESASSTRNVTLVEEVHIELNSVGSPAKISDTTNWAWVRAASGRSEHSDPRLPTVLVEQMAAVDVNRLGDLAGHLRAEDTAICPPEARLVPPNGHRTGNTDCRNLNITDRCV
jgi:hypothetical protein